MAITTVELLRELIRNRCANDGSSDSGHEERSVPHFATSSALTGRYSSRLQGASRWFTVFPEPSDGTIAYGVGLHDDAIGFGGFLSLFHGRDERVSLSSVDLTTELLKTVLAGFAADPGV